MDTPPDDPDWIALLAARDGGPVAGVLAPMFAPLLAPPVAPDGCRVVGRLAQTLDGRIATVGGSSQWIGGPGDILHTHRLRGLCHAVVVGAGTVRHDDPRLTTRKVPGPNPLRVVIDTERRLTSDYGVFREGPPTLLACAADATGADRHGTAEVLRLPREPGGGIAPAALLRALAARGLTRIFVEGGGVTVSRFLAAGCLDHLHVTVAPVLLGSGIPAFTLPAVPRIADGMRFTWTVHDIAPDILLDIPVGRARPGCRE
ncbi:RibD family protein [Roseomonas terrae]|uniref:RibD family protein n=1 Tax=Neoroseomonas terrae TaxID=424799 RepID=A0ABS5ED80_9PROT|nr:RibD family protein [Neoroseomonas terrae]MBR0648982.1 RibD family protein [Neoroseomonas terrae]